MDITRDPDIQAFIKDIKEKIDVDLTELQAKKAIEFLTNYGARDTEECFEFELVRAVNFARNGT